MKLRQGGRGELKIREKIFEGSNIAEAEQKKILKGIFYDYEPLQTKEGGEKHPALMFHESEARLRGIFGGNSSSKSYTATHESVIYACLPIHPFSGERIKQPNKGRISVQDFGVLEKLIFSSIPGEPSVRNLIPKSYLIKGSWEKSYDKLYKILNLKHGSIIDFTSYDQDATKYESITLDWHYADEEMPEEMYVATQARLLRTGGKFWMSVTPLTGMGWAEREIWEKKDSANVNAWFFDLMDNPYLNEKWKQDFIDSLPVEYREARVHGHFPTWIGKIYDRLDERVHQIEDVFVRGNHIIYADGSKLPVFILMGIDPHDRTATAISWYAVLPNDDLYIIKEAWLKGMDIKQICSHIKDTEKENGWKVSYRICDPNKLGQINNLRRVGWTLEKDFNQHGIRFKGRVDDGLEIGHSKVREYLYFDKTKPISMNNRPKIYWCQSCKENWYQMKHYQREEWKMGKDIKDPKEKPQEKNKHFPDVNRYIIMSRPTFDRIKEMHTAQSYSDTQPVSVGWYAQ